MKMEDLTGKLVLFKFSEELRQDLSLFQIYKDEIWALVTGIDDMGIWIQNSGYELGIWWDDKGNLIPPHKQTKEKVKTEIFIPWRYIKALMSVNDDRFHRVKSDRLPGFQSYK